MAIHIPEKWRARAIELWKEYGKGAHKIHKQMEDEGMPVPFRKIMQYAVDADIDLTANRKLAGRPPSPDATGKKWSEHRDAIRAELARNVEQDVKVIAKKVGCKPNTVYFYRREFLDEQKKKNKS